MEEPYPDNVLAYVNAQKVPLCKLGWSIANARKFYAAAGGRNTPEDNARQARAYLEKWGKEDTVRTLGLQKFSGDPSACESVWEG